MAIAQEGSTYKQGNLHRATTRLLCDDIAHQLQVGPLNENELMLLIIWAKQANTGLFFVGEKLKGDMVKSTRAGCILLRLHLTAHSGTYPL